MKRFSLILATILATLSSYAYKKESVDINVNGQSRNMVVFTPSVAQTNMPLMIVTHGMNQNPEYQYDSDKFYNLIDAEKFVVAYLRSDGGSWDVGGTKDKNFVIKTIDEMVKRHGINANRVYWSGFSMGSMLIYHCMPEMQDKIAAFAPTSGIQFSEQPWDQCKKPVNLIHCHAYGDDVFPPEQYDVQGYVKKMATVVNKATDYKKTANYNPGSRFNGDKEVWSGGSKGGMVELFMYNNGGHWPMDGNAKEIWKFCKQFSLKTVAEEYQELYDKAQGMVDDWRATRDMTSKVAYSSLQQARSTYGPEKMQTDAQMTNAMSRLLPLMNIFEKTAANLQRVDPNFHIYLCFGQSNMEGNAAIEAKDRANVPARFKMMAAVDMPSRRRVTGEWYKAAPPLCREYTGLTPADWFGRTMVANLPEEITVGVINVAVGGAPIEIFDEDGLQERLSKEADWLQNYCREYGSNPFRRLVDCAKIAQKQGVIKGILLHQGCSNNGQEDWPVKVKRVYIRLLNELGLNEEETPLLIGETASQSDGGVCWGHNSVIAKTASVIPNSHVISSAGCPCADDGLHFTAEGYRIIGKRYAEKMLTLLDQTKQVDFDTSDTFLPLTAEAFNPSLCLQGTYSASPLIRYFKGDRVGTIGGWRYSKGADWSAFKYLVVKLKRAAPSKTELRVYDTDDVLNPHFALDITNSKTAVIDLHAMTDADGAPIDPSHIYLAGFRTGTPNATIYIDEAYLSDDGDTPSAILDLNTHQDGNSAPMPIGLSGVAAPAHGAGIYIIDGQKVWQP